MDRRLGPNVKVHITLGDEVVWIRDWQSNMVIMDQETRRRLMHAIVYCNYVQVHPVCVQQIVFVCTRLVQDASGFLQYFAFPFRQRLSRLAPNEPITGSSIWRVLYGSPGSTISADESLERCGGWVCQLRDKKHRSASTKTLKAALWLHRYLQGGMYKDSERRKGCRAQELPPFSSHHYEIPRSPVQMTAEWATVFKKAVCFLSNEEMILADEIHLFSGWNKIMKIVSST